MRAFLTLAVVICFLVACTQAVRFQDAIDVVAADWDTTNVQIQKYGVALNNAYKNWDTLENSITLPPGSMGRFSEANRIKVRELQRQFGEYGAEFRALGRELNTLTKQWDDKQETLNQLEYAAVNKQKLDEIEVTITTLKETIVDANAKLRDWTDRLQILTTNVADTKQALDSIR